MNTLSDVFHVVALVCLSYSAANSFLQYDDYNAGIGWVCAILWCFNSFMKGKIK